jgi:hypothetical protein
LFRAATVPAILPLERSPRKDRAPLSRPLCSLAVIHPRAETHCTSALSPPFSPTPTLSRSCLAPYRRLWTNFPRAEAQFPSALGFAQQNRFVPPASPTSKLLSPCESVRDQSGLPRPGGRCSWVSSPLESSPTTPRVLDPPEPRGLEHSPSPEGSGLATKRTSQPLWPGETLLTREAPGRLRRRLPAPV